MLEGDEDQKEGHGVTNEMSQFGALRLLRMVDRGAHAGYVFDAMHPISGRWHYTFLYAIVCVLSRIKSNYIFVSVILFHVAS